VIQEILFYIFEFLKEFEKMKNVFPMMQLFLCLGACIVYALNKSFYDAMYWGGACIITYAVIFK